MKKHWCRHDSPEYLSVVRNRIVQRTRPDKSGCILWTGSTVGGYGQIKFFNSNQLVHRVVYQTTIGPIPEGIDVLHKCDTPACCNPEHLFLGDHAENMRDKAIKGRQIAKLTPPQVIDIKRAIASGVSCNSLSIRYGVSPHTISDIKHGITWKHVTT